MKNLQGTVRRCVEDYNMISPGDCIAVGLSGGKDSLLLLAELAQLRRYYPKPFTLHAITLSMGFPGTDFSPLEEYCRSIDVPLTILNTQLGELIFDVRKESNPCALCSKMRRGALCDAVRDMGFTKLALGHNYDDAVETFLMSLLYEGRLYCFQPVTYMSRSNVTQIRPLLYVSEDDVRIEVEKLGLPIVKNPCPMNGVSKRQEVKELIENLGKTYPDVKSKIFNSMQRLPLPGWEVETPPGKRKGE